MEIVDVVDENLNILYQVPKEEAHQKGLLHKTVIGEIINSRGEVMLVKPYKHRQDAGQFVSPVGGHVIAGESDEDALKREAMEEIGIEFTDFKLQGKAIFNRFVLNRQENHYFIVYEIYTDVEPILGDEPESYEWFSIEKLKKGLKDNKQLFGGAYLFVVENFYPGLLR